MKLFKVFFCSSLILALSLPPFIFASNYPSPEVEPDSCPKDKPWKSSGHWAILRDGQYGAEVLEKSYGFKWKIAKRSGSQIIPIWCEAKKIPATTELLNKEFSSPGQTFMQRDIVDSGNFKTIGFWVYTKQK